MKKLLNKNTIVLLDQAVFSGGSFLITIVLARFILAPFDFGVFSSITLFNYALVSLLNAVIVQPFQVSLEKMEDKNQYVSFSFWMQFILVLLCTFGLFILLKADIQLFESIKNISLSGLLFFVGFVMHDYSRKIFLAKAEVLSSFIIDCITTFLHLSILTYCWYFNVKSLDLVLCYFGLSYIPSFIFAIFTFKPLLKNRKSWKSYLMEHLNQGKWLLLTTLTQWWASNLFIVTAGVYLGVTALGAFRLVQSLFGILNLVLQTFENFVLPEASRRFAISAENSKIYLRDITKKSGILFGVVLLILFVFSKEVMNIAGGSKYLEYAFIMKGMSVLYAFIFIGYPVRLSIRLLILNKVFFTGYLLSFIFSVISFNYLLETWKINGAIIGLIASQIIVLIYWQSVLAKNKFILWK